MSFTFTLTDPVTPELTNAAGTKVGGVVGSEKHDEDIGAHAVIGTFTATATPASNKLSFANKVYTGGWLTQSGNVKLLSDSDNPASAGEANVSGVNKIAFRIDFDENGDGTVKFEVDGAYGATGYYVVRTNNEDGLEYLTNDENKSGGKYDGLGQRVDEYSSKTYANGDLCYHEYMIYKCTKVGGITVAEDWTAANWTRQGTGFMHDADKIIIAASQELTE